MTTKLAKDVKQGDIHASYGEVLAISIRSDDHRVFTHAHGTSFYSPDEKVNIIERMTPTSTVTFGIGWPE